MPKKGVNKATRRAVWQKTGGQCWYCGIQTVRKMPTSVSQGFCVDHQIPVREGGSHALSNLVPSCHLCNTRKGTKSLEAYRLACMLEHRPTFTPEHLAWLQSLKIPLPEGFPCYPPHVFWYEQRRIQYQRCVQQELRNHEKMVRLGYVTPGTEPYHWTMEEIARLGAMQGASPQGYPHSYREPLPLRRVRPDRSREPPLDDPRPGPALTAEGGPAP